MGGSHFGTPFMESPTPAVFHDKYQSYKYEKIQLGNLRVRQGRHPVSQDCSIASLHQDPQSPPPRGAQPPHIPPAPSGWTSAAPSFLTSRSATSCQPPKDSTTIGRKAIPCLMQSSPKEIFQKFNFTAYRLPLFKKAVLLFHYPS